MKGMILAAGYGTRLRPLTFTLPKPMMPLCNRTLLGWAVESYLAAGIRDLIVNVHHLPNVIEHYLASTFEGRAHIHVSRETDILGTGGAVRRVRPLLENEEEFFLVNGDTIQFLPYDALRDARRAPDALAALLLRHPPAGDQYTAVWLEGANITGFGTGSGTPLMFAGAHLIHTRIFRSLPDKDFSGIVDEVYRPLLARGEETIAAVVDDGAWFDIGTPSRYLAASHALREATVRGTIAPAEGSRVRDDSLVHGTAVAPRAIVRSVVGAGSVVHGELQDTVVWDGCTIAGSARLESCIVAHGVDVPANLELRNAILCRNTAAIPHDPMYERREGLVIVRT